MTGMVLASLVIDGIVALDDEIGRWLDADRNSGITLMQLATHTSGLPRLAPGHTTGAADPYAFLTPDVAERELRLSPPAPRGVEWDYSNFGFQVLSLALERAAGISFSSVLEQHVFGPLKMSCSGVAGHGGGTSGFRAMLGLRPTARRAAVVFVSDRAAHGLGMAVRRALERGR